MPRRFAAKNVIGGTLERVCGEPDKYIMKRSFIAVCAAVVLLAPSIALANSTIGVDNHYSAILNGFYLQTLDANHTPSAWSTNLLNDGSDPTIPAFTSDYQAVTIDQDVCAADTTYNVNVHWSDGTSRTWYAIDFCSYSPGSDFTDKDNDFWAIPN